MMTESQALETLTREDPEAAGDARAALAWLTGDEGLETISLLRLQEFLWYALPVKWPMSTPGPGRRGEGAGPPVPAGGPGPVRRSVLLGGHREDHQRLRGRARGRDRRLHRGHRGVERGPAGHGAAGLGFGHGIAGTRRLRRLRGRPGTRLRLRRAERGRPRLAEQARVHRQPLADRPPDWRPGRRRRAGPGPGRRRRAGPGPG